MPVTTDLDIGLSLGLGLPIISDFSKSETVSRGDFVFETGTDSRINESGSIDGLSMVNLGIGLASRYQFWNNGSYSFSGEAEVEYNLNNLSETESIRPITARLGVSIAFLEEALIEPLPEPEPEPEPPLTVKPEIREIKNTFTVNGKSLAAGDTAYVGESINRTHYKLTVLPRIFFSRSGSIIENRYENLSPGSLSIKEQISEYYKGYGSSDNISLRSYYIPGTEFQPDIYIEKAKQTLGLSEDVRYRIDTVTNTFQYPELIEEYRRVDVLENGSEGALDIDLSIDSVTKEDVYYTHTLEVEPDSLKDFVTSSITTPGRALPLIMKDTHRGALPFPESIQRYDVQINNALTDSYVRFAYYLSPQRTIKDTEHEIIDENGIMSRQYVLGYNDFDEVKLIHTSDEVLDMARKALAQGRQVTVVASTDNLGDPDYNKALAERRAREAVKLIGGDKSGIDILIPEDYLFDNTHPYGRQLNRAILLRIGA
jgi:hypothetical protein